MLFDIDTTVREALFSYAVTPIADYRHFEALVGLSSNH